MQPDNLYTFDPFPAPPSPLVPLNEAMDVEMKRPKRLNVTHKAPNVAVTTDPTQKKILTLLGTYFSDAEIRNLFQGVAKTEFTIRYPQILQGCKCF